MVDRIDRADSGYTVAEDVMCLPILMVNVCLIGQPRIADGAWVLVDTALRNSAERIIEAARNRFGTDNPPKAIILTHGHFDHVGAVQELTEKWKVPVYAHSLEIPYLTGQEDYPPPDPTVDEGLMAKLSPLYPNESIDLGNMVRPLPQDGSIPSLPDWRWIHTPGHTPGHISLFREADRVLIAGDAFTTVEQESALAVLTQEKEVHGPPKYFTTDWQAAWQSTKKLEAFKPSVVITGHGKPMQGSSLAEELATLVRNFDHLAIPEQGRYVPERYQR